MKNKQQQTKTFHDEIDNSWKNNKVTVIVFFVAKIIGGIAAFLAAAYFIYNFFYGKNEMKRDTSVANHQEIIGNGNNQAGGDINITTKDSTVKSGE